MPPRSNGQDDNISLENTTGFEVFDVLVEYLHTSKTDNPARFGVAKIYELHARLYHL